MTLADLSVKLGWDRLRALADEVATTIYRTAFSPLVRDSHDLGAGIFDAEANMLASADVGPPGHMNPLRTSVRAVLDRFTPGGLVPGDVVVLNDPWISTSQLLDITVVTPLFNDRRLVGFAANVCHYPDVGGLGTAATGTDVYEEGLFIPPLKLYEAGVRDEKLLSIILSNSRLAEMVAGDLDAATGANEAGRRGVHRILNDLGLTDLTDLGSEILSRSEVGMRDAIGRLRPGTYESALVLDGYDQPVELHLRIVIEGGEMLLDFDGTSPQSRHGINACLPYSTGYAQYGARMAITATLPNNSGTLAPIRVKAPEGSILNCRFPAPVNARHMVGQAIPNVIMKAMVTADPPFCIAESCGGNYGLTIRALSDRGPVSSLYFMPGGVGARRNKDGLTGRHFPSSVRMLPIEVLEQDGLVRVVSRERRRGSGGVGRFHGGDGLAVTVELLSDAIVNGNGDRTLSAPAGTAGGHAGALGRMLINGEPVFPKFRKELKKGDIVHMETPGGGGWGTPD